MKKHRIMSQMKEQDKTLEKQVNEVEIGNIPKKEFRIMVVKMIQDLGKRMEAKTQGERNAQQRPRTKEQTGINSIPEGINSRITEAEEQINDLEDRTVEISATEQNIEKRMNRNEDRLRDLGDNIKCTNICIMGVPEGEEREKGPEKIFEEIIAENFLDMGKEIVNQVQEAQRVPGRITKGGTYQETY